MKKLKTSWPLTLLLLLLLTDLVLIGLGAAFLKGLITDPRCSLSRERGYAEFFEYTKLFWAAALFGVLFLRRPRLIFGVGTLLFTYMFLDDAFEIHETVGAMLIEPFNIPSAFGLRAVDFGELIVSMTVGTVLLVLGALAYRFGDATSRRVSIHLVVGCIALAIFGIGLDMAHSMLVGKTRLFKLFGLLEDGGELIIFSFFAWYAYCLLTQFTKPWTVSMNIPNLEETSANG